MGCSIALALMQPMTVTSPYKCRVERNIERNYVNYDKRLRYALW